VSSAGTWRCRVSVTLDGKLFQTRGAATKARSPIVERRDDGVTRADVDAERSRLRASMSATRHIARTLNTLNSLLLRRWLQLQFDCNSTALYDHSTTYVTTLGLPAVALRAWIVKHNMPRPLEVDLWPFEIESGVRVTWATPVPILIFLGLSVIDLGPMYATDRQTSDSIIA